MTDPVVSAGPRTEAGKRLATILRDIERGTHASWPISEPEAELRILAIEAEAALRVGEAAPPRSPGAAPEPCGHRRSDDSPMVCVRPTSHSGVHRYERDPFGAAPEPPKRTLADNGWAMRAAPEPPRAMCGARASDASGNIRGCVERVGHNGYHVAYDSAGTPGGKGVWTWQDGESIAAWGPWAAPEPPREASTVTIDGDRWPWPGETALPWQVWNEVPHPDGMTIYDPDGFRFGKPTVVTWAQFDRARTECTPIARDESGKGETE